MDWLVENKEWLFGGIGATILGCIMTAIFSHKKKDKPTKTIQRQNQTVNIHFDTPDKSLNPNCIQNKVSLKDTIHILFVDDEKFNMINILKQAGWKNVSYKKDIINIDDSEVQWAHVIFVDINGVGCKLFNNQGLGLAAAIKAQYPAKKVIIYSAEPTGNRFDTDLRKVDACLPKNAEPIQFSNLINELISNE